MAYVVGRVGSEIPAPDYNYDGRAFSYLATAIYQKDGDIHLSWRPRKGAEKAKYNVFRMPDDVKVASEIADTAFTEPGPKAADAISLWYRLEAVYPDSVKAMGISSIVSIYNNPPFLCGFNHKELSNEFTIFDADQQNGWWNYSSQGGMGVNNTDDWLVSPGILLKPGKMYRFSAVTSAFYRAIFYSASMGRTNDYKGLDTELIPSTRVASTVGDTKWTYFSVPEEGNYFFGIRSHNPEDPDNVNTMNLLRVDIEEVDGALPLAVDGLKAIYDGTDVRKAKVSMTLPTKSMGGTDITTITKVELYKNGELSASKEALTAGTTLDFDITVEPGKLDNYRVVPFTAAGAGKPSDLEVMIILPRYANDFSESSSIDGFTCIDANLDSNGWGWFNSVVRSYPESSNGSDDWLMTPALYLEAGKYYRTSMLVSREKDGQAPNVVETYLGTEPTVEAMKTNVVKPYQVMGVGYQQFALLKDYFTVDKSGAYYLGIHSLCPSGTYGSPLLLDDLEISAKINGEVPDTVTSFSINPDMGGKLNGEIKFKSPTTALNGTPLSKNEAMKVYIYASGSL